MSAPSLRLRRLVCSSLPLASALLGACTFNVEWLDREITAPTDPGSYEVLTADASLLGAPLEVAGTEGVTTTTASAHVVGLVGVADDPDEIVSRFSLRWDRVDAANVALGLDVLGTPSDGAWLEDVRVALPADRDVVVLGGSEALAVTGALGRVEAHTSSGAISVSGAGVVDVSSASGAIDVAAAAGHASTTSGAITLALAGWVDASTTSGSIGGAIGGGGTLSTTSGSIDVTLTGPLDRDLWLSAGSGSIRLLVPVGAAMTLDLVADGGAVTVMAGGVEQRGVGAFRGALGGGGFTVGARTGSGSIVIVEGSE